MERKQEEGGNLRKEVRGIFREEKEILKEKSGISGGNIQEKRDIEGRTKFQGKMESLKRM